MLRIRRHLAALRRISNLTRIDSRASFSTVNRRQNASVKDDGVLNKVSRNVTQPKSQGASQAMLYATGLNETDMNKAQVGISSVWYSGNPCNMHLMGLNNIVKEGVQRAGQYIRHGTAMWRC
jgi:dihydroxy-acid dehydratase